MAYTWDQSLSTGVPRIDAQHQELIRRLNGLLTAMKTRKGFEELPKILDFLGEYVQKHFSDEEAEMEKRKCPATIANKLAHKQFINQFQNFRRRLEKEGPTPTVLLAVQKELCDWVINHIKQVDTKLALVATQSTTTPV